MNKELALVLALGVLAGIPALALSAAPPGNTSDTRSKHVSLADIDLSTPEGMAAARERVHQAARNLCSQVAEQNDLSRHSNYLKCMDQAMAGSLAQVAALAHQETANRKVASNERH